MKKLLFIALLAIGFTAQAQVKDGKYILDFKTSTVSWHGDGVAGHSHEGTVKVSSGNVVFQGGKITGGKIKMNMNDMTCSDITDPGKNAYLINHLKNEDFFNTAKFPDAVFEISSARDIKSGSEYMLIGKMTIKGISQDMEIPVHIDNKSGELHINGKFSFDRSKFDVKYTNAGDHGALNEVKMNFDLTARI